MARPSLRDLFEAGVHYGHRTRYWNPAMAPYIYGARNNIHVINLDHTLPLLNASLDFVAQLASRRNRLLFVGTKIAAQDIVREEAQRCGMPYVNHRWLGGMLTNYKTVRLSIKRLRELEKMAADGVFDRMIKKEGLNLRRELDKLENSLGGIKDMAGLPEALFVIDVGNENIAISEAKRLGIPVIGVVDTNNNPAGIDYVIPGNDDAQRAIAVYCRAVADVIIENKAQQSDAVAVDEYVEINAGEQGQGPRKPKENASAKKSPGAKVKIKAQEKVDQEIEPDSTITD